MASGIVSTRVEATLVQVTAADVGVAAGASGTLAEVAAVLVDTLGPGPTWVAIALVQIHALQRHKVNRGHGYQPWG